MTETTEACIRGCTMYGEHLAECDRETCRGCLPERAKHGHLCHTCHRRFELMLTDAPTVVRWLGAYLSGERSQAMDDMRVQSSGDGLPEAVRADVLDVRQLLTDRLAIWADQWAEEKNLTGPQRHTPEEDSRFLLTWLRGVESLDWIGDWCEELAESMIAAHALAPWRPAVRRVPGVPCPRCAETNLVIYGGESDVTCQSCKAMMTENEYWLWENVLQAQEVAS